MKMRSRKGGSLSWQHVGQKVKVSYDRKRVELYLDHRHIAIHVDLARVAD